MNHRLRTLTIGIGAATLLCWALDMTGPLWADVTISNGQTLSLSNDSADLSTGTYDNYGVLQVDSGKTLTIGTDLVNSTNLNDPKRIDLGVAQIFGTIDTNQMTVFAEGSILQAGGKISGGNREHNIVFAGPSTVKGDITADRLVFNPSQNTENTEWSVIDFSGGNTLAVNEIVVNGLLELTGGGSDIVLATDLNMASSSAQLTSQGHLTVEGNFTGYPGSTLIVNDPSKEGTGTGNLILLGGGVADSNGYNNLLGQSSIQAALVRLENDSCITASTAMFSGNLTLGADSNTDILLGTAVRGRLTLEENSKLKMVGDATAVSMYGSLTYGAYNGIFAGGFELKENAQMVVAESGHNLQIAFGATSSLAAGSLLSGSSIYLAGTDGTGSSYTIQDIKNSGTIQSEKTLDLIAVELTTTGSGTIEANSIKLTNYSKLIFENGDGTASLKLTGDAPTVSIGENSVIKAENKIIDFGSASVTNVSYAGGIEANIIYFGSGGRYEVGNGASLLGGGLTRASAIFRDGSTLALNNQTNMNFAGNAVTLQSGATVELNIGQNMVGMIETTGKVTIEDGVTIAVTEASNFEGRVKQFLIAQGSDKSEYGENLKFKDSLFFNMTDSGTYEYQDTENSNKYLGLWVEITKIADLVDYAGSQNQRDLAVFFDALIDAKLATEQQQAVYDALMIQSDDETYRNALDRLTGSVRENAVLFALNTPWRSVMDNIGFNRLSLALERKTTEAASTTVGQRKSFLPSRSMASRGGLSHDLWFNTYYHYDKLDSDSNTVGGEGNRGGFLLGAGLPTGSKEALLGISFGYSAGDYKQDDDKVDLNDFRVGLYGGANLFHRNLQIRGYIGYGLQDYKMDRTVSLGNLSPMSASGDTDGTSISGALMLIRPIDMSPRWMLKPSLGIDVERLTQDGFSESGHSGIAWIYDDLTLTRTMMRFGITSDYCYRRIEWNARVVYGVKLAGDSVAMSRHFNPSTPGSGFDVSSVNIGPSVVDIGFGGHIGLNAARTSLLFFDYNGAFAKNNNTHTASLGVLWKR